MAKKPIVQEKTLTRKQAARHERDLRAQRIITGVAIGLAVLVVSILGYGLLTEVVLKGRTPVAKVGDVPITTDQFQARVRYQRVQIKYQINQYQSLLDQLTSTENQSYAQQIQISIANLENQLSADMANVLGGDVLDQMVEEELVRQAAPEYGLQVSDEEVTRQVESLFGYDSTAVITSSETMTGTQAPITAEEYQQAYQNFQNNVLKVSELTDAQFRQMVAADLLKTQLQAVFSATVATTADQVKITYLVTDTQEVAQAWRAQIESGANPISLTEQFNTGGELPWLPVGYLSSQLGADVEKAAFNTPVGQTSEPVLGSDNRYYLLYVQGHEERPLDDYFLQQARDEKYNQWLEEQRQSKLQTFDWQSVVPTTP